MKSCKNPDCCKDIPHTLAWHPCNNCRYGMANCQLCDKCSFSMKACSHCKKPFKVRHNDKQD